jgi:transposase
VDFIELLKQLGLNGAQRAAAVDSIVARMAAPGSELAARRWLAERSALGELLNVDFEAMPLMQLYRASDALMAHRAALERHLFDQVTDLFGLSTTVTLYDLTNTYFEGEAGGQDNARRGRSKEKRSDCPLLTLGLVLDASGFVRRSEVFVGNVSEASTLASMLGGLDAPGGALIAMDRGVATEANLAWLREQGYRYLVVSRERTRHFDPELACSIETASKHSIQLQKDICEDGSEVRLYCYSEARAGKEQGIAKRFAERFERGLDQLAAGLSRPRTHKRLDRIHERIGRLKEKSHGAAAHYRIEVIPDASGEKAAALRWEKRPRAGSPLTRPGVYCLRTNQTDWDAERLWRTYIMLTDLEAVFRSLKSELGLRPVYHRAPKRCEGHLFITVLAYQLVQLIRRRLAEHGETASWRTLRAFLEGQQRVTATFRRADGRALHVRKATRAEANQLAIYTALGIDPAPGGVKKMLV